MAICVEIIRPTHLLGPRGALTMNEQRWLIFLFLETPVDPAFSAIDEIRVYAVIRTTIDDARHGTSYHIWPAIFLCLSIDSDCAAIVALHMMTGPGHDRTCTHRDSRFQKHNSNWSAHWTSADWATAIATQSKSLLRPGGGEISRRRNAKQTNERFV